MSTFSSVTTGAARTQDLSLNPQKLAGQCSKLKCCMMYEYDVYAEARKEMPRLREPLQTAEGEWFLVKSDILAGTMTFSSSKETMSNLQTLPVWRVKEVLAMNRAGKHPEQLQDEEYVDERIEEPTYRAEEDSITRFDKAKRRRNKNRNKGRDRKEQKDQKPQDEQKSEQKGEQKAEPKSEQPTEQRPKQEHPKHDRPKYDKPKQERPKQDRPQHDRPKQEATGEQSATPATEGEGEQRQGQNHRGRRFHRRPNNHNGERKAKAPRNNE